MGSEKNEAVRDAQRAAELQDWLAAARALSLVHDPGLSPYQRRRLALLKDGPKLRNAELRQSVLEAIDALTSEVSTLGDQPTAFIVHGWDAELKWETKNFVQGTLDLPCVILHEQGGKGGSLLDKFEHYAHPCDLAFILLSEKDDPAREGFDKPEAQRRPRPNVLFEMGYFYAQLGRSRVVLLRRGDVEIHSDALGIEYIDVTNGVESAGEEIRRRLTSCL
jgi:predicted nucleotide-binding protein